MKRITEEVAMDETKHKTPPQLSVVFRHPLTRLFIVGALALRAAFAIAAEKEPPPHPAVGQRFVPMDVDWSHPVYATTFDTADALADWKLEGGRSMSIVNGRLVLESDPGGAKPSPTDNHLVCWLTKEMPADFLLEFKVRPQDRKNGLNIIFFNARGLHGENIFDPALKPRTGIFAQYHSGDLNNYHISYWAGERGTANVRKNAGFRLVATGKDLVSPAPADSFQTIRLYKRGAALRLMVDDASKSPSMMTARLTALFGRTPAGLACARWLIPSVVNTTT